MKILNKMEITKQRIKTIVAEHLCIMVDEVQDNSTFNDLGMDSLDTIEVVMLLEKEFMLIIPDAKSEDLHSMEDLYKCLESCGVELIN